MSKNNRITLDWARLMGFKLVKTAQNSTGEKSIKNPAMAMMGTKIGQTKTVKL